MRRYRQLLQESQRAPNDEDEPVEEFGDESDANTLQGLMRQIASEIEGEIADEVLGRMRTDG
jgi:sulfur transfer protein SufE